MSSEQVEYKQKDTDPILPKDKLLLVDLDKTLIDASYRMTDISVLEEIKRVQSLGWTLGFSSDTPLEPLKIWSERFGFNGPIVAEKGSVIWTPAHGEVVLNDKEGFFTELKNSLIVELINRKIPFVHGDVTQLVRNDPNLGGMADNRLVLINGYRRCSLSFFVRNINSSGNLEIDLEFGKEIVNVTKTLWREEDAPNLLEDFNPDYGIYILSPEDVSKRSGTQALMKMMSVSQLGMIGDSQADILGHDIALHYAVGNAKPKLKEFADYVASSDYSSGVKEILSFIK